MESFSQAIMRTGNTIVYIDEITQLVHGAADPPRGLKVMITQGRSASVGVWVGTQRPMNVPIIVKDQAEVWFIFRLTRKEDRETVEGHIPTEDTPELVEKPLPVRYFWYYEDTMDRPVLIAPIKLKAA